MSIKCSQKNLKHPLGFEYIELNAIDGRLENNSKKIFEINLIQSLNSLLCVEIRFDTNMINDFLDTVKVDDKVVEYDDRESVVRASPGFDFFFMIQLIDESLNNFLEMIELSRSDFISPIDIHFIM